MGNYLSSPVTAKYIENGETDGLRYSICGMQGWRVSMEDAHLAYIFGPSLHPSQATRSSNYPIALFGVYDGHGGSQVAQFVSRHMLAEFLKTQEFRAGHYGAAFKTVYIMLDQLLSLPEGQMELETLSENPVSESRPIRARYSPCSTSFTPSKRMDQANIVTPSESKPKKELVSLKSHGSRSNPKFSNTKASCSRAATRQRSAVRNLNSEGDFSTAFESLGVSEEHPTSNARFCKSQDSGVSRRSHLRRKRESLRRKKVDYLSESSFTNQFINKSFHTTCSSFKGKLLNTIKASESSRTILAPSNLKYSDNIENTNFSQDTRTGAAVKRFQEVPASSSSSPNVSTIGNLFSMQTLKSLLSTVARLGSSVGRHGVSNGTTFASFTGCTALTVLMTTSQIVVANAGDSRCVLCRGDLAIELSRDHKPGLDDERARIYAAGGWLEMGRINGNLNLSRAIGDLVYKSNASLTPEKQIVSVVPDIVIVDISDQDSFLILGCDGIWESATSQDIVNFIKERINSVENMHEILEALFEELLSPNPTILECGCDNMTAILVDLKPHSRSFSAQKHKKDLLP